MWANQEKDNKRKIIGISIARNKERGETIINQSIQDYLGNGDYDKSLVIFEDKYTKNGYNQYDSEILDAIKTVLKNDGVALNVTYTGKAYYGMLKYIEEHEIKNKQILFVNTGGLPLFFDNIEEIIK